MNSTWRFLVALLAVSCETITGSEVVSTGAGLSVRASSGRLSLRNDSAFPVHYVAVEEREAALVDLYFDPSRWLSIAPRNEVRIRYQELTGYKRGSERAIVYWWTEQSGWNHLRIELK